MFGVCSSLPWSSSYLLSWGMGWRERRGQWSRRCCTSVARPFQAYDVIRPTPRSRRALRVGSKGVPSLLAYVPSSWPLHIAQLVSTSLTKSGGCLLYSRALDEIFMSAFSLHSNSFLQGKGVGVPKATSTGTTIVGCLFRDGIVLGADTRATEGEIVADKNCEKVRGSHNKPSSNRHTDGVLRSTT